jgi:hypothetical protein
VRPLPQGELDPGAIKQYYLEERKNVFGFDHKTDRSGKPIEQGIGSPGNQSANSVAAFEKYCSHQPDFERELARMKKELAASNERRAAERTSQ